MKKVIVFICITLIVISIFCGVKLIWGSFYIASFFHPPVTQITMERDFRKNKDSIIIIKDYLCKTEDTILRPDNQSKAVGNNEVDRALKVLWHQGYEVIAKDENSIIFQKWSNLDSGKGIVYIIDNHYPTIQFLTSLAPLSEAGEGWYYYEE